MTVSECCEEMTTASTRTGLRFLVILHRDLALAVGTQVRQLARRLADLGEAAGELVSYSAMAAGISSGGHHWPCIAEHHALVAPAPPVSTPWAMSPDCLLMVEITAQVLESKP